MARGSLSNLVTRLANGIDQDLADAVRIERNRPGSMIFDDVLNGSTDLGRHIVRAYRQLYSQSDLDRLRRAIRYYQLNATETRNIRRYYDNDNIFDLDADLVNLLTNRGISRYIESDHLLEQRIYEVYADGFVGMFRGQSFLHGSSNRTARGPRIGHIHAVAVPANDIVGHQLIREGISFPYLHRGTNSKTARMREIIPNGAEGLFLPHECWGVSRSVLIEFGIDVRTLDTAIKNDFTDGIAEGIIHDTEFRSLLTSSLLPNNIGTRISAISPTPSNKSNIKNVLMSLPDIEPEDIGGIIAQRLVQ